MQPLFWCQQSLGSNLMGHPALCCKYCRENSRQYWVTSQLFHVTNPTTGTEETTDFVGEVYHLLLAVGEMNDSGEGPKKHFLKFASYNPILFVWISFIFLLKIKSKQAENKKKKPCPFSHSACNFGLKKTTIAANVWPRSILFQFHGFVFVIAQHWYRPTKRTVE